MQFDQRPQNSQQIFTDAEIRRQMQDQALAYNDAQSNAQNEWYQSHPTQYVPAGTPQGFVLGYGPNGRANQISLVGPNGNLTGLDLPSGVAGSNNYQALNDAIRNSGINPDALNASANSVLGSSNGIGGIDWGAIQSGIFGGEPSPLLSRQNNTGTTLQDIVSFQQGQAAGPQPTFNQVDPNAAFNSYQTQTQERNQIANDAYHNIQMGGHGGFIGDGRQTFGETNQPQWSGNGWNWTPTYQPQTQQRNGGLGGLGGWGGPWQNSWR